MKNAIKLMLLLFVMGSSLFAQTKKDYSKEAGFFDFNKYSVVKEGQEATTEIYLEEPMLKFAGKMAADKDGKLGEMISKLKLVRVIEYLIEEKESDKTEAALSQMDKELLGKNWQRIIRTKNKNNFINVYIKPGEAETYNGVVVTMMNPKGKVSFVNVVGNVDLETIGKLSSEMNLPGLDSVK